MASKPVVDAVNARLAASWTGTIIGPNLQTETPNDGSEFLSVQYPTGDGEQITIGSPGAQVWRESGTIRFVLSMPSGVGDNTGLTRAATLAALFRGVQFGGVSTWAPSPPISAKGSGNYWLLSFVVPYYFDLIG